MASRISSVRCLSRPWDAASLATPDNAKAGGADLFCHSVEGPPTWNRYTYALNNPLHYIDPLGLFPSPSFNCTDTNSNCLRDEQRRTADLDLELEPAAVSVNSQLRTCRGRWRGRQVWGPCCCPQRGCRHHNSVAADGNLLAAERGVLQKLKRMD